MILGCAELLAELSKKALGRHRFSFHNILNTAIEPRIFPTSAIQSETGEGIDSSRDSLRVSSSSISDRPPESICDSISRLNWKIVIPLVPEGSVVVGGGAAAAHDKRNRKRRRRVPSVSSIGASKLYKEGRETGEKGRRRREERFASFLLRYNTT